MAKTNYKIVYIPIIKLMLCIVLFQYTLFDPAATFGKTEQNLAQLTDDEISWLDAHPIIRLAPDPEFQPIEFFDKEGNYAGIGADYVRLISEKLGIKFEVVRCTNWDDALARMKRGEVDLLNAVVRTPQREKYLHFPPPYLEIPSVIIVRKNVTTGLTLDMLKGLHVVMVSGYGYVDLIRNKYPEMRIELVSDLKTALRKVSFGMANAFVGDLATASFYIELDGITNLRIAGESDPPNISGFAVRSDWSEFGRILEKGVALLTEEERKDIFNKWIHLQAEPGVTTSELKKLMVGIIIFIALFGAGFLLWNRQLKRLVNLKVEDLNKEIKEHKQTEDALRDSKLMVEGIINTVPARIFWKDKNLVYLGCNQMFVLDAGFTHPDEIIGKDDSQMVWYEQAEKYRSDDREVIESGSSKFQIEESQTTPDGNIITLLTSKIPLRDASGEITGILGTYIDITDRKRVEKALRESEEKYRLIINNIPDVTWTSDAEGRTTYISPNIEEVYGYTPEEIFKDGEKLWFGRVHSEDLHILKKSYKNLFEQDMEFDVEYRIRRKDGQWIWLHDRAIMHYEKGKKEYAFGIFSDITERKQAEKELHKLSSIVEQSFEGIALADLEGNLTFTNSSWNRMHNYEPDEELIGKHLNIFHNQEQLEQEVIPFNQEVMEIGFNTGEVGHIRKDGTPFPTLMNTTLLKDEHGKPYAIAGMAVDITERKHGEQALAESAEKYRLLFENINDAVAITQNGKYIYFNQQFCQMLDYTAAEMDHKDYREVFSEEGLQILAARQQVRERGEEPPARYETVFVRKDGQLINIEVNVRTIDYEGQPAAFAVLREITERKQAEEERIKLEAQLRQSQKLEAVGTMAGGIAHDFNNILQGLYLYSGMVKDQLPDDEQLREHFQHIIEAEDRAKELVRQILTFSRKGKAILKPTKIQYLIKDALKLTRASTPTIIEIIDNIDTKCGAILCDATQIHQVFINLCNNAAHAMQEEGGILSVSLKEVEARIETEPGKPASELNKVLELQVSDTGKGMDAATLGQIFDPFFTTKDVNEGTGLGLSIIHGIIKEMRGQILVESKPDKGTTFRILMPLSGEEEQPEEIQEETDTLVKGLRVLFVDDDKMISSAGKLILEAKGYEVDTAGNGHEALELFHKDIKAYDLIFTDLTMPKMTGLELGKEVRKLSKDVIIVLTSGNLDAKLQTEFVSLGFNGFVRKPWTAPEMLRVISSFDLG
ncbi:MAG: PAS domain S-box protein [Candidatus Marinimicrobia bacterium]|nr:PAS domain S-box protein [Candidatus Neomarinimicrobiota bacterium]